jgi:membrane fusion protein (multidrug efflux system)
VRRAPISGLCIAAFALACGRDDAPPIDVAARAAELTSADAPRPERVEIARALPRTLRAVVAASGTVEARRITEIATEVPGRLESVFVRVGDAVEADALLFRVDPGPYEMALAEARAGLALARAESANAAAEAERLRLLLEQSAASQQRYEQLRTQARVARARVEQMEARAARAQRDLERTEVRAPYAGSVIERRAHEGALADAGPVLVLQESGALEAILNIPESTPVPVRVGDPVRLFVEGRADPIETAVARVSERVDPATRTYEVRCAVDDPDRGVKAGSYARAELEVTRDAPRPVVARSSVLARDGRSFVIRVEEGVAKAVQVRVGILDGDWAEILSGLAAGDLVVQGDAAQRIPDGTLLRVDGGSAEIAGAAHGDAS